MSTSLIIFLTPAIGKGAPTSMSPLPSIEPTRRLLGYISFTTVLAFLEQSKPGVDDGLGIIPTVNGCLRFYFFTWWVDHFKVPICFDYSTVPLKWLVCRWVPFEQPGKGSPLPQKRDIHSCWQEPTVNGCVSCAQRWF